MSLWLNTTTFALGEGSNLKCINIKFLISNFHFQRSVNACKKYSISILSVFFLVISTWAGECVYKGAQWNSLKSDQKQDLLNRPSLKSMDVHCFVAFMKRFKGKSDKKNVTQKLFIFLKEYCTAHSSFDPVLLHAFIKTGGKKNISEVSEDIITLWKTYNGPVDNTLDRLEKQGQYSEADNIYNDFDALSQLDVYHLIKWAGIKGVLSDYSGAARLFCRISVYKTSFISMARSQFFRLLAECESPEIQRKALDVYKKCYLSELDTDTLALSIWLSRTCNRLGLFKEEVDAVVNLDRVAGSRGERLFKIAQKRFRSRLYSKALLPALLSWKDLSYDHQKQECAIILYQSYIYTGKKDSAIVWLERVNLTDLKSKANAVSLYQESNLFDKADSVISTILKSVCKDTLTIRQFLFKREIKQAASFASKQPKNSRHWVSAIGDNLLWKIRTAVFIGNMYNVGSYLDSINSIPYRSSWKYAAEVLSYKMAIQRLVAYPDAFKYWGKLQYAIYTGNPGQSVATFKADNRPGDVGEYVAVSLIDALIREEMFDTAQIVLGRVLKQIDTPHISFLRGYVYFMQGNVDKAKKIFENIILLYPDNVFAPKARIYLLKLKKS
jgi:tetratricopeptide (TPR) repeat protein